MIQERPRTYRLLNSSEVKKNPAELQPADVASDVDDNRQVTPASLSTTIYTSSRVSSLIPYFVPTFEPSFPSPMSFKALDPRMTAQLVCSLADHVKVETAGVSKLAEWLSKKFTSGEYSLVNWKQHELHPKKADRSAIEWIFLVDSLNFSFWTPSERYDFNFTSPGISMKYARITLQRLFFHIRAGTRVVTRKAKKIANGSSNGKEKGW